MTQAQALEILKLGKNVFLTGPAGSGKTFLLNEYIDYLKKNNVPVGITASTGIASTHISGRTVHSWSGLKIIDKKLNRKDVDRRIKHLMHNESIVAQYRNTKVLVIDEISMLDAEYLDLIDTAARAANDSIAPFGGMQVVLCGDFFQLPPISTEMRRTEYAYKAKIWEEVGFSVLYLEEPQRYIDNGFVNVLNDIRHSQVGAGTVGALKSRINKPVKGNIKPTKLYTRNFDVNAMNDIELDNLKTREYVFTMKTYFKEEEHRYLRDHLVKHCMAPYHLALKTGAVVMFVKNHFDESGINNYVNGTMGIVVDFAEEEESLFPIVEVSGDRRIIAYPQSWSFDEIDETGREKAVAAITQIPLRLAWAITVHKSQGMSMDEVVTDLSGAFEYGMGYVALSRVRSLEGLCLLGLNEKALKVNPEISKFDSELRKESEAEVREFMKMKKEDIIRRQKEFIRKSKAKSLGNLIDAII